MKFHFTPGPWILYGKTIYAPGLWIANTKNPYGEGVDVEMTANALLISAAPQMLEALMSAHFHLNSLTKDDREVIVEIIRNAIAAATGHVLGVKP